jgi:hypothetical protein
MNEASTLVTKRPDRSLTTADRTARNLGWFSIALGVAELFAPRRVARAAGVEGRERLLQGYGLREIQSGIWALSDTPAPAIWSRVAGDLVDLATLLAGPKAENGTGNDDGDAVSNRNRTMAIAAVLGITAIDLATALALTSETSEKKGETRDYSDRSGFPRGVQAARGIAGEDAIPVDYKVTATEERRREYDARKPELADA